ncbi:MAG: ferritin family protein [Anaerolineae bacterium]|nr:ferritin family protein [Anaerolineae bacterium]
MNIQQIYHYALQREHEGQRFFEESAARAAHAAAAGIFRTLAEEEARHIQYIEALLAHLDGAEAVPPADLEPGGRFAARAEAEYLDQTIIESMIPDVAVLRTAYLIERDFAEFYETSADRVEGQAQAALRNLAAWERGHERLFKDLHDRVFEMYANMPWGG